MSEEKAIATTTAEKNLAAMDTPTTYIPGIKVTYGISEHFQQGKAKLGDFFYNNELSLGTSIVATAVGYRYQAMSIDKSSKDFVESLVLGESDTPFRQRPEYKAFCERNLTNDIIDGVDILLYLPEHNIYGVIFCKKKLLSGGLAILAKGSKGATVTINTVKKEWKKFVWFILDVKPTGKTVKVDEADLKLEIYNANIDENTSTGTEEPTNGRKR